jgi:hypothetical protein
MQSFRFHKILLLFATMIRHCGQIEADSSDRPLNQKPKDSSTHSGDFNALCSIRFRHSMYSRESRLAYCARAVAFAESLQYHSSPDGGASLLSIPGG